MKHQKGTSELGDDPRGAPRRIVGTGFHGDLLLRVTKRTHHKRTVVYTIYHSVLNKPQNVSVYFESRKYPHTMDIFVF